MDEEIVSKRRANCNLIHSPPICVFEIFNGTVREIERERGKKKNAVIRSMEDYSEDFYKSLNWIEIYEDYHYEIWWNLIKKMDIMNTWKLEYINFWKQ